MAEENRTRTRNMVIRLSDRERDMLDAVATREELSASEAVRWLVRREFEAGSITTKTARPKAASKRPGKATK